MLEAMDLAIFIGSALVVASVFTSLISFRFGAPLLLVFLAVGLLAGEDGPLGIDFDNAGAAFFVGALALAIILFDSGFETRAVDAARRGRPALVLATVGVLLTAGLVGLAAHLLFGFAWLEGLLLGAIVAPTDAAAVFFLLRVGGINLRDRVRSTLEVESGSNDPIAIFLTITLVELIAPARATAAVAAICSPTSLIQIGVGACSASPAAWLIVRDRQPDRFRGRRSIRSSSLALALGDLRGHRHARRQRLPRRLSSPASSPATSACATPWRSSRFQHGTTWLAPDRHVPDAGPAGDAVAVPGAWRCRRSARRCS